MSGSLAQRAFQHARLTVLVVAAVLAGAAGGAWATGVAPSPVQVFTVADQSEVTPDADDDVERTPKADKPEKADKPDRTARTEKAPMTASAARAHGVHGACVSAVAKDKDAIGGKNENHGGAVSKAAHDCPR